MSTGVITSLTLIDFPSESEMTDFFVFFENNIESFADELWAKFMTEKASKSGLVGKVAPHRCVVQHDYS